MTSYGSALSTPHKGSSADVNVLFYLYTGDDWPPFPAETVSARMVEPFVAVVTGIPWYAYDISRGDRVVVSHDGTGYLGRHVKVSGGHSTVRVVASTNAELSPIAAALTALGADVTFAGDPTLLAVDVPPFVDLAAVRELLAAAVSMTCNFEVSCDRH